MDKFVDERDFELLKQDPYTFLVLQRIMKWNATLLLSDHDQILLCYSNPPFPIWIWTRDNCTEEIKDRLWNILVENELLTKGMKFNVKYEIADYLIKRATKEGMDIFIRTNMLAYECKNLLTPHVVAEGSLHQCTLDDLDKFTAIRKAFHSEIKADERDDVTYRKEAEEDLKTAPVFFWKNNSGKVVAACLYKVDDGMACIGHVYTFPEERRKHYAENVVYHASKKAASEGYDLTLYTDGDYIASNSCYQKIGYELQGRLCMVEVGC